MGVNESAILQWWLNTGAVEGLQGFTHTLMFVDSESDSPGAIRG